MVENSAERKALLRGYLLGWKSEKQLVVYWAEKMAVCWVERKGNSSVEHLEMKLVVLMAKKSEGK
jgi:hypothetical protein